MKNQKRELINELSKRYMNKKDCAILFIIRLVLIIFSLISPYFFSLFVENIIINKELERLPTIILSFIILFLFNSFFLYLNCRYTNTLKNIFSLKLRNELWHRIFIKKYKDYNQMNIGDYKTIICDDVEKIQGSIIEQLINYRINFIGFLSFFLMCLYINWFLCIVFLALELILYIAEIWHGKKQAEVQKNLRDVNAKYYDFIQNTFKQWKTIKSLSIEDKMAKRNNQYKDLKVQHTVREMFLNDLGSDIELLRNYFSEIGLYIVGVFFIVRGEIGIETLILFSQYFKKLCFYLRYVFKKRKELIANAVYYTNIETLRLFENSQCGYCDKRVFDINLKNVYFKYNEESSYILKDVNLDIKAGEKIALIGGNGSGKTSLLKVISGMYDPEIGDVLVDNTPIENIREDMLYKKIGVVMQHDFLFNLSIRENLLLANRNASEERIIEICKSVNLYQDVCAMPNGLDTVIGENGIRLSGGQRQKLSIAQVLIRDPQIILLDEFTSALDGTSEQILIDYIIKEFSTKTVVMATHRPALLKIATKIVRIQDGRIVETKYNNI